MQCSNCGNSVDSGASFCSYCGSRVGDTTQRRPSAESVAVGEQRLLKALRNATLGEYEIQGEIGRGGMAVVFLAHDVGLNRKVAIKVMTPALMLMDEDIQARFKREAQTAASLSHPHIIPVYAVREADDLVFFVMKHIVGSSLEAVLKEAGALPFPVVQTILSQAGGALAHAHNRGVVHRDIKPGNIMLDEDGWVVVADFGIAKVADTEALTMTGGVVGTPAYMSPEQCSGGTLTGAADQYSLGIVAYEMITGRTPFKSGTMVNLIYDHCHTEPPPILDSRPDCPPQLAEVVMRMIEKDPADRFPDMDDAVAATGFASDSAQEVARTHMLTLAQVTDTDKLLKKFQAGSPVPPAKTPMAPSTPSTPMPQTTPSMSARRGMPPWVWAVPLVGVTAALVWVVGSFGPGPSPEATNQAVEAGPTIAGVSVQPLAATLPAGEILALDGMAIGEDGGELATVPLTWQTTAADIADVSNSGLVTARRPGTAQITARAGGASASITVTVTPPPAPERQTGAQPARVAFVQIIPDSLQLFVGDRAHVAATISDGSGVVLGGRSISWSTSNEAVATVDAAGTLRAMGAGTARVRAVSEGIAGTATITVMAQPVASLIVSPPTLSLTPGATASLNASVRDRQQRLLADRSVTWRSSNTGVVSVTTTGIVTAIAPGNATITATAEGQRGGTQVTVGRPTEERDTTPVRDHRAEIDQAVESYRLAINSHDVRRLRSVFPNLTDEQEAGWTTFFNNTSDLTATFNSSDVSITGETATATIAAIYNYHSNRDETRPLTIIIQLRQMADRWQIVEVR